MSGTLRGLAAVLWLGAAGTGMNWLWHYSLTAGETVEASPQWPAASHLERSPDHFTLVMFAHPECPCSRASLEELGTLMAHGSAGIRSRVVFFQPEEKRAAWGDTDLWRQARGIPGVLVSPDGDGRESALFLAKSSGDTFVYDKSGRLVFHGGITAARGHCGDNAGRSGIEALVDGSGENVEGAPVRTPVYGCPLREGGTSSG